MSDGYHITRIFGLNKKGEIVHDIWVDVERRHQFTTRTETDETPNQKITIYFQWSDDPDGGNYTPEEDADNRFRILKICDVENELDIENPEQWVPVKVMLQVGFSDHGKWTQRTFGRSSGDRATPENSRRIFHYDTNIDAKVQKLVQRNPNLKAYVASGYKIDEGSKDTGSYIEQYVTFNYPQNHNRYTDSTGYDQYRGVSTGETHPIIAKSPRATLSKVGNSGYDPPYRLDPFQVIVNCTFYPIGAVFVVGDSDGQIWRGEMETKTGEPKFKNTGITIFDVTDPRDELAGRVNGGAYALIEKIGADGLVIKTPVFVLAGQDNQWSYYTPDDMGHVNYPSGVIKTSNDGTTWSRTFHHDEGETGEWRVPSRVVWDDDKDVKAFFVEMGTKSPYKPVSDPEYAIECWTSKDGQSWSNINSQPTDSGGGTNSVFESHCKFKYQTGSLKDRGLDSPLFGLDKTKKDFEEKYPMGKVVGNDGKPASEGNKPIGLLVTVEDMIVDELRADTINFAGQIWGRNDPNDRNTLEVSTDVGENWRDIGEVKAIQVNDPRYSGITVVVAGGYKDIKKWQDGK